MLDPVRWVKRRIHNILKLNVIYGWVFACTAVMIINISSSGWLEGCQCGKLALVPLHQALHPPGLSGGGHQHLKVDQVAHLSDLTLVSSLPPRTGTQTARGSL